jgi:hypothetical protein
MDPSSQMDPQMMAMMVSLMPFLQEPGAAGTDVGMSQMQAPTPQGYDTWDTVGRMARLVGQSTMGSDGGGEMRPERYVHGAPQGMPPKIGNPQTDFQMASMQSPVSAVGQFLLSPAGQQIIKVLQSIGH